MATSTPVSDNSQKTRVMIAGVLGTNRNMLQKLSKKIRRAFGSRRVRSNTVYALLIASIFFTLVSAIVTCTKIRKTSTAAFKNVVLSGQSVSPQNRSSSGFNPLRFSSFVLLALTCSLALTTIIKKDKNNARLLTILRSTNSELEEEVRKRTSELAEAIRAKDHFLGIATHDLKAPLSGILGLVELIRMENNGRSAAEVEYLGHIEYSCRKMQRLIYDLLEINRLEQGKAIVKKQRIDLRPLLSKIRMDFAHQAVKKNIEFIFDEPELIVETDADGLTRILENLLSNAIKFSPPMKKVSLSVRSEHDRVKFEVADEGPGIPLDEQPKLFNRFQRLSNRPTNSENSTGLGLSIVKELTMQLGGEVRFKTAVGKGCTFIVTLPLEHRITVSQ